MTLPPTLARILSLLVQAAPRTVTKQELLDGAWPERVVSEAALTQRIKELRRLLADDARHPRLIGTVTGRGYRLLEEATPVAAGSPASGAQRPPTAVAVAVVGPTAVAVAGDVFCSMVERALRASEAVSLVPAERLRAAARFLRLPERRFGRSEEDALTVARRAGTVAFLVVALLRRLDATYVAEVRIVDVEGGDTVRQTGAEARSEHELVGVFGRLASWAVAQVEEFRGESVRPRCAPPAVTTDSLDALDAFARALEWADRFEWRKAADLLKAAVRLDSRFAMAWAWLASAQLWLEEPRAAERAAARAAALAEEVSENERHFVLAVRASFEGRLAEAIDHLELLLALDPCDFWAAYRLAHLYLAAGRTEDSLSMRERCAALRPEHVFNFSEAGFTRLFAALDLEGAARDYARVVELDPHHAFALPFLIPSFRAWLEGDCDRAGEVLAEVLDRRLEFFLPVGRVSALVHDARFRLFLGDAAAARADLERALDGLAQGSTVEGWVRLELALALRDLGDAAGAAEQLARMAADGTALYRAQALLWQGMTMIASGDTPSLESVADRLRCMPVGSVREFGSPMPRLRERVHRFLPFLLEGERALVDGNAAAALQAFAEACGGLPANLDAPVPLATTGPRLHLAAREGTARALAALGRYDEAYAAESWILDRKLLLFVASQGGVGVWMASLARRAALSLARGRRKAASRDANEVIARWGRLVPEPPVVRQARRVAAEAGGA